MDLLALAKKKELGFGAYDLVFPDTTEVPDEYRGRRIRVVKDPLRGDVHLYPVDPAD